MQLKAGDRSSLLEVKCSNATLGKFHLENFEVEFCAWVPENSELKTDIQYENKTSHWRFHCTNTDFTYCIKNSVWLPLFFPFFSPASLCPSLNRAAVFWVCLLVCFVLFGFSSVALSSLHPSFFPSASFSPGAYWCSLITGARRELLPTALLCEGCTWIRCVCAYICLIWLAFDFFVAPFAQRNNAKPTLFPAFFWFLLM